MHSRRLYLARSILFFESLLLFFSDSLGNPGLILAIAIALRVAMGQMVSRPGRRAAWTLLAIVGWGVFWNLLALGEWRQVSSRLQIVLLGAICVSSCEVVFLSSELSKIRWAVVAIFGSLVAVYADHVVAAWVLSHPDSVNLLAARTPLVAFVFGASRAFGVYAKRTHSPPVKGEMTQYQIYVFCNECSDVHPVPISVALNDGPPEKASVGDVYRGKALPPQVVSLISNQFQCPKTGRMYEQKDNNQVFLVPTGK